MPVKAPYSGVWLRPKDGKVRYRGPAAIALKRTISRGWEDLIPWRDFNNQYNETLAQAVRKIQRQQNWDVSGTTARRMFTLLRNRHVPQGKANVGDFAMDHISVGLFEEAYAIKYPPQDPPIEQVREAMADHLYSMEQYAARWRYSQARPFPLGREPSEGGTLDCSGLAITAYFEARQDSGIAVPDPGGYNYQGVGNTQSIWRTNQNRRVTSEFEVGDCALYGPSYDTRHVTICRRRGSASTAVFSSHGSEIGPIPTRVYYRTDFLAVVRPKLIAAE